MKTLQTSVLVSLLLSCLTAYAGEPSINITVSGEVTPGVYGEIQIGNAPPPPVVYVTPVIITPRPHHDEDKPVYLHVPPGHAKNWARHCREYNACNRHVYFVRSAEYEPGYSGDHDGMRGNERKHEHRGDGRRDEGRRDEGSRGEDSGHGHGNGNEGRRDEGRRGEGSRDSGRD